MYRYFIKTACLLLISSMALAQTKDEKKYSERASEVQQEVMDNLNKAFDVTTVPEEYKNESAVVIARSFEITNSIKSKFKMFYMGLKTYRYYTTIHERVLIQDKSALDEYSTLNYKKIINRSSEGFRNIANTYIGAKVFKRDGKIISINPKEEEVIVKDKKDEKEGRIAIPDLQVGDIIDYYIRLEEIIEDGITAARGPDIYMLADEYPVLYLNAKYILDKKSGVDVLDAGGITPIASSTDDDGNIVLEFTERNLPKINNTLWTSMLRQVPMHIIRYNVGNKKMNMPNPNGIFATVGEVRRNPYIKEIHTDIEVRLYNGSLSPFSDAKEYFDGEKKMKSLPADTIIAYLWNYHHYNSYIKRIDWLRSAAKISQELKENNIDNTIFLATSRFDEYIQDSWTAEDYNVLIRIDVPSRFKWLCFNDYFQTPGLIGAPYQGEKAVIFTQSKNKYFVGQETITLPVAASEENVSSEELIVSVDKSDPLLLGITRTCTETGSMKTVDQKHFLMQQKADDAFRKNILQPDKKQKLTKAQKEFREKGIKEETEKQPALFKDEIRMQFDQEPKELIYDSIMNEGLDPYNPEFVFSAKFSMENFVHKAGNNFILDAGKLMGTYKKQDENKRTRTLDIYMPAARILKYKFLISVPDGYNVKGIENISKKLENETGSFASSAEVKDNIVTITVKRIYNHNFEPAANWPKLLAVMDAGAEFTNTKLLFEKKK